MADFHYNGKSAQIEKVENGYLVTVQGVRYVYRTFETMMKDLKRAFESEEDNK